MIVSWTGASLFAAVLLAPSFLIGPSRIFIEAIQFHSKGSLLQNCLGAQGRLRDEGLGVLGFLAGNEVICPRSYQSAHEGSNPEEPELADSPTTDEQRDTCASRRIDRSIRYWNAYEVNQRQREANRDGSKASGCALVSYAEYDQQKKHSHNHFADQSRQKRIAAG